MCSFGFFGISFRLESSSLFDVERFIFASGLIEFPGSIFLFLLSRPLFLVLPQGPPFTVQTFLNSTIIAKSEKLFPPVSFLSLILKIGPPSTSYPLCFRGRLGTEVVASLGPFEKVLPPPPLCVFCGLTAPPEKFPSAAPSP